MIKEISTRTEPLHQAVENLSKQQQPFLETLRDLRQSQLSSNELSSKLDPLNQSIKAIQTGFFLLQIFIRIFFSFPSDLHHQTEQILKNLDQKFNDSTKRSNTQQEQIEKNFQPFSQMIKTLRESRTTIIIK